MAFTEKIGNIPFASLIACIIVFVGVGVFCGTLYRALTIIIKSVMQELFQFNVSWLEVLQIVFIVIAVVMALFAILLLIFSFLATGATRKNVYSGASCIMGGRISAAFFMVISYILNLAWLVIMSVGVIPVIVYLMLRSICNTEIYSKDAASLTNYCFSLTQFGVYRNQSYPLNIQAPGKEELCGHTELRRFCDRIEEAGPLFCIAYVGAALICLGMLHFMITLAANYTRIRISKELTDYRDAVDMEELELHSNMDKTSTQQY
ncbi:neuronal membrane glycoprotein M6-a-like [Ruditapes philippinarum]|uniref:neuronal membrane glycoprotein M6-a-like n=1 Tax=Ruditapes philippinarum TaxID=129788 RepID=UPI00295A69B2|nr:neuronal membrane glycoprotein M6-a-like [Ruditapes philippinarum]